MSWDTGRSILDWPKKNCFGLTVERHTLSSTSDIGISSMASDQGKQPEQK
jgi:hypothetical protein